MSDTFIVDLDVDALRRHREREERRPLSPEEIERWLARGGITPRVDGLFVANHKVLRKLNPSEIRAIRPVGTLLH
jgi:hypothetical protein